MQDRVGGQAPCLRSAPALVQHASLCDYNEVIAASSPHPCVELAATAPLYTLYTSGTTGQPKGILRDNSYAVALAWSMPNFMGVAPGDTYWSASDIGWVVGHSYIVYAPLITGCTSVCHPALKLAARRLHSGM